MRRRYRIRPYQNAKSRVAMDAPSKRRLLAMLEDVTDLTLERT